MKEYGGNSFTVSATASSFVDGSDITQGAKADAAATIADTTPFSVIALLKGLWNKLGAVVLAQGTAIIGKVSIDQATAHANEVVIVGGNTRKWATGTVTIGTGAAHSANDVVSTDAGAIISFTTGLVAGTSGVILSSLTTLNQNAVFSGGAGYYLYLFDESPAAQATNAAFNLTAEDMAKYICKLTIGVLVDNGDTCSITDVGHNQDFTLAAADTKLYGKLVCVGGETTVSAKVITINLGIAAL